MKKLENNGKQADAIRIARQLINQPRIYPSNDGSIAISFVNRSSAPTISRIASRSAISTLAESERLDAFVTLKKHGELEKVIAEAERKAKASPLSFLLQEQLSELYEFAGDNVDAEEATLQALKIRPSASSLRIHYLRNLRSTGKTSEACAQFVALVNRDPNCGLSMMAEMLPLFEESGKQSDLLGAVQMAHFQSVTDWDELLMVAYSILGAKNGLEVGCLMFEKLAQLSPQLRQQALTLLLSSEIKKYPRLMNFLLDALIPKENDVIRDPWFGLQDQNASNETGEAIFQKLLTSNRDEEIEKKLEPAVLAAVERMPNWMAGKVMLAMIAVRTNRNLEAKRLIAELASDKRLSVGCPPGVALRLATEFVESPEARKTAINLISPLIGSNNFVEFELAKQPSIVLAKLLIADGQRAKADEVLTREYESGSASVIAYYASSKSNLTGNALAKVPAYADQLLESGLPIESYRLFEKHTDELNVYVPQAMLRKGNLTTREAGQQAAIVLLESLTPDKAIFEILQDRSNPSRNHPALELMLQLSPAAANRNNGIESMIQKTLLRHAVSGKQAEIEAGLQRLLDLYPSDLSILTTQARVRLATGSGDVATTLSEIERIGAAFDTEIARMLSEAKERPASFPVPHFSESIVSTWLIARQCLETDQHVSIADKIANRAWQAASLMDFGKAVPIAPNEITRTNGNTVAKIITSGVAPGQNNLDIASTILSEWGKVLVKQGRTEAGIAKWNELMAMYDLQEKESKQWTTPQFEEQLQLAQLAIDFGQLEVSYDIAKRIARKEPPTPEAPESMRNRPSGFSYQLNRELVMKPSIKALNALLQKWGDKNSPPSVCCDLLLPIIFPNDQGVYLFSDQSRLLHLLHEPPTNLAAKLVDHATRAGRLGDLKQLLERRNGSVTPIILMTQIAIAEKDYENAKRLLAKLHENYQAGKAIDILAINCQIAIPAFRVEELQEAALPILQELMLREQEVGKHPDASFKRFPLVREVDAYLSAKINRQSESSGKQ